MSTMLTQSVELWPTPRAGRAKKSSKDFGKCLFETAENHQPKVELWMTPRANKTTPHSREDFTPNLDAQAISHSSLQPECRASQPVPPVSERAVQMTVGSGRKLSAWLNEQNRTSLFLKTLLESQAWRNPLRLLEWRLIGYGKCQDEPSAKSSRDLMLWDMNSLATETGFLGFRLCRLRVLEPSTEGTGFGLSDGVEMWATPNTMDSMPQKTEKGIKHEMEISRPGRTQPANLRDQVAVQAGVQMWATPKANMSTGAGEHGEGSDNIQTQVKNHSRIGGGDGRIEKGQDEIYRVVKPGLDLLVNGLPGRVAKLRGFGNSICPQVAEVFAKTIREIILSEI